MMAFKSEKDREAYVGKLKAAGFSPEEIDADVAEIEASQPAPAPVAPLPAAQPNLQPPAPADAVKALADVAQARSEQNQDLTGQVLGNQLSQAIKDLSGSTLSQAGLAAAGGYGLYKAGRLAERKFGPSGEIVNRIEPTMEAPKESARLPAAAQQSGLSDTDQALLARSEANRVAKEQEALKRAQTAPTPAPIPEPPAFIRNQPPVVETPANPKIPALPQAPAGAVAPPVAAPVAAAAPTPVAAAPAPTTAPTPASATPSSEAPAETPKEKPTKAAKPSKSSQPAGTGGADNWLHSAVGPDIYADVIKRKNEGKPYGPGEAQQTKAYKDWREYQNEVGRMRPYTKTPVLNLEALEAQKFKSANIPGKIPFSAVPPPMLRPTEMGQGGGSLLRSLTDQLQLKQ
jgi:hypothetical protein